MNSNGIKLYQLHTCELGDEAVFCEQYKRMSLTRREKVDAYHFPKDKKLALGAGILLDRGLQTYGLREEAVRFATGENEKPFLPDYPQIHFNISHSEQMVIAVFAPLEVGCDIEYMAEIDLALAQRFFCRAEYAYILGQEGDEAKKNAFYRLWTLKESFMKATGLGMLLPLADFCVSIDAKIAVHQQVDDASYIFQEYPSPEYRIAICLRQEKNSGFR